MKRTKFLCKKKKCAKQLRIETCRQHGSTHTGTYHLTCLLVPVEQLSIATGGLFQKYLHIMEAIRYSKGAFIRAKEEPA